MPRAGAPAVALTPDQFRELTQITHLPSAPQNVVLRAKIVLGAALGVPSQRLARELSTNRMTVLLWRQRFEAEGVPGILEDRPRSGRPKQISLDEEAEVVELTRSSKPRNATHWTVRTMARRVGVSPATVHRIWQAYGLQPHRLESFKFSTDPEFVSKVRDIVGLYLNPPDKALVLSVDEKSQIQALDRTQPILPLRPGLPERQTHDYIRHGTTTLFAALNVLDGSIIGHCQPRHRHQEFLRFLERIEARTKARLDIHIVLDNYGTHKHPVVKQWFSDHPRYHLHFTPTGASWINQIERWFAEITSKRIRRGTFRSVRELTGAIQDYIRDHNREPKPFTWTATAAAILRKIRKCKDTSETGH